MEKRERDRQFLLLQVNDALFPIGAYSHSYGLETYIQKNQVKTVDETWEFLVSRLLFGFCYNEFLSAKLAYEYAAKGRVDRISELEDMLEAARVPREIREAGRKLGSRFIKTMKNMELPFASPVFQQYVEARKKKSTTHAVVYGTFCAAVGIDYEAAMEHFLYAQASSMVTNCVKTIPLSQTDGQQLLYRCHGLFHDILQRLEGLGEEDLCQSVPGFDIRCMQHEGLYSRIYMS